MTALPENIEHEAYDFLDRLFMNIDTDSIDVSGYELDHLCYRVASTDEYKDMKVIFSKYGSIVK
jgi:predicted metalloenzyme YecM